MAGVEDVGQYFDAINFVDKLNEYARRLYNIENILKEIGGIKRDFDTFHKEYKKEKREETKRTGKTVRSLEEKIKQLQNSIVELSKSSKGSAKDFISALKNLSKEISEQLDKNEYKLSEEQKQLLNNLKKMDAYYREMLNEVGESLELQHRLRLREIEESIKDEKEREKARSQEIQRYERLKRLLEARERELKYEKERKQYIEKEKAFERMKERLKGVFDDEFIERLEEVDWTSDEVQNIFKEMTERMDKLGIATQKTTGGFDSFLSNIDYLLGTGFTQSFQRIKVWVRTLKEIGGGIKTALDIGKLGREAGKFTGFSAMLKAGWLRLRGEITGNLEGYDKYMRELTKKTYQKRFEGMESSEKEMLDEMMNKFRTGIETAKIKEEMPTSETEKAITKTAKEPPISEMTGGDFSNVLRDLYGVAQTFSESTQRFDEAVKRLTAEIEPAGEVLNIKGSKKAESGEKSEVSETTKGISEINISGLDKINEIIVLLRQIKGCVCPVRKLGPTTPLTSTGGRVAEYEEMQTFYLKGILKYGKKEAKSEMGTTNVLEEMLENTEEEKKTKSASSLFKKIMKGVGKALIIGAVGGAVMGIGGHIVEGGVEAIVGYILSKHGDKIFGFLSGFLAGKGRLIARIAISVITALGGLLGGGFLTGLGALIGAPLSFAGGWFAGRWLGKRHITKKKTIDDIISDMFANIFEFDIGPLSTIGRLLGFTSKGEYIKNALYRKKIAGEISTKKDIISQAKEIGIIKEGEKVGYMELVNRLRTLGYSGDVKDYSTVKKFITKMKKEGFAVEMKGKDWEEIVKLVKDIKENIEKSGEEPTTFKILGGIFGGSKKKEENEANKPKSSKTTSKSSTTKTTTDMSAKNNPVVINNPIDNRLFKEMNKHLETMSASLNKTVSTPATFIPENNDTTYIDDKSINQSIFGVYYSYS